MKVCVVGLGNMGRNHKRVLESMGHEVATVDSNGHADFTMQHKPNFRLFPNAPRPNATVIAVPVESLAPLADYALRFGPVLVEKPGALTSDALHHLHGQAERHGTYLKVGYTEDFNPVVEALAEQLGRVGTVRHIGIRRLGFAFDRGCDPALDLATHDLSVLLSLGLDLEVGHVARSEHHLSALLYAGTATVSLEASHLHPVKIREIEVVGDAGVLQADYQAQTLGFIGHERMRTALPVDQREPLAREWEAFFDGKGSTGVQALQLAEQMMRPSLSAVAARTRQKEAA